MKHFMIATHIDEPESRKSSKVVGYRIISLPEMKIFDLSVANVRKALNSGTKIENLRISSNNGVEIVGKSKLHYPAIFNGGLAARDNRYANEIYTCVAKKDSLGVLVDASGKAVVREIFREPFNNLTFQLTNVKLMAYAEKSQRGGVIENRVQSGNELKECKTQQDCGIHDEGKFWYGRHAGPAPILPQYARYSESALTIAAVTGRKLPSFEECGLEEKTAKQMGEVETFNSRVKMLNIPGMNTLGSDGMLGNGEPIQDFNGEVLVVKPPVTGIGKMAFYNKRNLKELRIEAGVNSIGESAFASCNELEKVYLDDGISLIDKTAFANAMRQCKDGSKDLTLLKLPNNPGLRVGEMAFTGCRAGKIVVPEKVPLDNLPRRMFRQCGCFGVLFENPGEVVIGQEMFAYCYKLNIVATKGSIAAVKYAGFYGCTKLKAIDLRGVSVIEQIAFSGCENLQKIELDNIEYIGEQAFDKCKSLREVIVRSNRLRAIAEWAFAEHPIKFICNNKVAFEAVNNYIKFCNIANPGYDLTHTVVLDEKI